MTLARVLKPIVAFALIVTVWAMPAQAQNEPQVVKALYDLMEELAGERPTHAALLMSEDGTITISGAKMLMQNFQQDGQDVRQEFSADELIMKDVRPLSDVLFEVGKLEVRNGVMKVSTPEFESFTMETPVVTSTGVFIRSPAALQSNLDRLFAQSYLARSTVVPLTTIKAMDWSFDIHDISIEWDGDPITYMGPSRFKVGSFELPASLFAGSGVKPSLGDLGYDKIVLGLAAQGDMQKPAEFLELSGAMTTIAKAMGSILIDGKVDGLQPALLEASQSLREQPTSIDINAMMAMAQTISIEKLRFRYDDASLAERMLSYLEKTEGKSRDQIAAEAAAMAEYGMVAANSPALTAQAKTALQTFLTKPGWIELSIAPDAPVTVAQIMPLLQNPPEIVKLLNINITAGQAD